MTLRAHPLKVAVAGAGFAGLATASLLARAGHQVTVFEKFASPQSVGAGILVQPSGLAAMAVLGIADEVLAHGARVDPWGAAWAVLDDPHASYGCTLWQWYRSAGQMLGVMPTGRAPGRATPVVSLFWSLHADRFAAWQETGLAAFKREVLALHPGCGALLEQLQSMEQLTWARYHDVTMPAYHRGRCVVVGDAAHATSPQLGQGTNLALLDAVVLADCLADSVAERGTVLDALARYTRARRPHLHFYGQASRWLTPLFQSDLRALPWLRDLLMRTACSLPVAGALTRQTLVGMRAGWLPSSVLDLSRFNGELRPHPASAGLARPYPE
ncbi:MAG: FAD-dependent monooxygenase [Comamonadaceae bacterium]|nr:MAG: FAD-dependent monooxygenase [Comamonadaceae bacterium]